MFDPINNPGAKCICEKPLDEYSHGDFCMDCYFKLKDQDQKTSYGQDIDNYIDNWIHPDMNKKLATLELNLLVLRAQKEQLILMRPTLIPKNQRQDLCCTLPQGCMCDCHKGKCPNCSAMTTCGECKEEFSPEADEDTCNACINKYTLR